MLKPPTWTLVALLPAAVVASPVVNVAFVARSMTNPASLFALSTQVRFIADEDAAAAVRLLGAAGGVVATWEVVALAVFVAVELPPAFTDFTRK